MAKKRERRTFSMIDEGAWSKRGFTAHTDYWRDQNFAVAHAKQLKANEVVSISATISD